MTLVFPQCGAYALDNKERAADHTTCSACGQTTPTNIFPLFIVTGTSGAGKTTVIVANFMDKYSIAHETSFNLRPLKSASLPTNSTGRELGLRPS